MDRTEKIVYQLGKMLADGEIEDDLVEKIEQLIEGVREGSINLYDYRRADSEERYGKALIEVLQEANRRQEKENEG